jgi:hypothetical protein
VTPLTRASLGGVPQQASALRPLKLHSDPLSPFFAPPVGDSPGELFKYVLACQAQQYGNTILRQQPNQYMHIRHLKLLLRDHTPMTIKRAIKYASLRSAYPYGIRWIRIYSKYMESLFGDR